MTQVHNLAVAIFLVAMISAAEQADAPWMVSGTFPIPDGARLTVEANRQEYLLGENVLLRVRLHNDGKVAFKTNFGGDYRCSGRSLRFMVVVTDEAGSEVESPDPNPMWMGGLIRNHIIKPGENHEEWLSLLAYRRIDHPGQFTIKVTHDFGWVKGERKPPVGNIILRFRMPSVDEAEQIVARMDALT